MESSYRQALAQLFTDSNEPTPKYTAYLEHRSAHEDAVRARDEARAATLRDPVALQQWPVTGRRYEERIDAAMDRWLTLGFKTEVEKALARVRAHDEDTGAGCPP